MTLFFFKFVVKLFPLYLNIILGYIAGKKLKIDLESISKLMFYMISPLIIFNAVATTQLNLTILSLPLITFGISSLLCIVFYLISRKIWTDSSKNIMAFSAGSGATGYFGIPLAMMILEPPLEGIYIWALLGVTLYDNSIGYYMSVKETYTPLQCLLKVFTLPTLYALFFALLVNFFKFPLPHIFTEFITPIKGVYVVLGMMIIGIGFANLEGFKFDFKFVGMAFLAKFLAWPLLVFAVIALDVSFFGLYDLVAHQVLIIISIVPLAVNSVIIASLIDSQPEKMAATVLLSTLVALVYVPLMVSFFINA